MAQDYGFVNQDFSDLVFLGDHPRITKPGVLISGQNLSAGTVLGVITASGKYTQLAPAAEDGSETAAAVLLEAVDASAGDEKCVVVIHAEALDAGLTWPDGITAPQKAAAVSQLQDTGIYVK